jgi:hypothetical protein
MTKKFMMLGVTLLLSGCMAWAADNWTGVVSEEHCGTKHSTASDKAAACVEKCVAGGSKYVVVSGDKVYQVEPQEKFKGMGGKQVTIQGTMNGDAITATSVKASAKES